MRTIMVLIICVLALTYEAASAESWKVWGNGYLPPMAYIENGVAKGFGLEITKAVLDAARIEHAIEMAPWQRAYKEAEEGRGMVFGMYWTASRAEVFDYSKPLWEEKIVLVTRKGHEFSFIDIADLRGKRLAMQRGTRPGTEFERAMKANAFIAEPDNNPVSRLYKLQKGRVDAAVFNPGIAAVVWNAHRAGLPPDAFTVLDHPLSVQAKHIGISKSLARKDLIQRIDAAIRKLESEQVLERIMQRYESVKPQ